MLRNLFDRTRVEVKRSPSIRHICKYGQTKCDFQFFGKQKQLEHSYINFVIRTLKQDFMLNLSHIGEMKWPTKVRKLQTIEPKWNLLDDFFVNCIV